MNFAQHPTIAEMIDNPNYARGELRAMVAAANEYDAATGTNQLDRDKEQLQMFIARLESYRELMTAAHDPLVLSYYASEIDSLSALIETETARLGL